MDDNEDYFEIDHTEEHLAGEYGTEITLILTVLGRIDSDLAHSLVTNTSKFSDFDLTDEELDEVSMEIGVNIVHGDLLMFAAKKIRGED